MSDLTTVQIQNNRPCLTTGFFLSTEKPALWMARVKDFSDFMTRAIRNNVAMVHRIQKKNSVLGSI